VQNKKELWKQALHQSCLTVRQNLEQQFAVSRKIDVLQRLSEALTGSPNRNANGLKVQVGAVFPLSESCIK